MGWRNCFSHPINLIICVRPRKIGSNPLDWIILLASSAPQRYTRFMIIDHFYLGDHDCELWLTFSKCSNRQFVINLRCLTIIKLTTTPVISYLMNVCPWESKPRFSLGFKYFSIFHLKCGGIWNANHVTIIDHTHIVFSPLSFTRKQISIRF